MVGANGIMRGRFGLIHGSGVRLTEEYLERSYIDLVWPELCERRMVVAFSARLLNSDGLWPRSYFEGRKTIVEPESPASFECRGIRT
jgi:hypothetical protein